MCIPYALSRMFCVCVLGSFHSKYILAVKFLDFHLEALSKCQRGILKSSTIIVSGPRWSVTRFSGSLMKFRPPVFGA